MKRRFIFRTISLIAAIALSSCAPAGISATNVPTVVPEPGAAPVTTAPVDLSPPEATAVVPVQAIATSRGPNLEATDPSLVNLAAGQLQLVEFFRFT